MNKKQKEAKVRERNLRGYRLLMGDLPFPECADKCSLVEYFGVGECESFCPHKFDKEKK